MIRKISLFMHKKEVACGKIKRRKFGFSKNYGKLLSRGEIMKKVVIFLTFLFLSTSTFLSADDEIPRLLYQTFLPFPDGSISVFGRLVWDDDDDLGKPMADRQFACFFKHRAKKISMKIGIKDEWVDLNTDIAGDFEMRIPSDLGRKIELGDEIRFLYRNFSGFPEKVKFELPKNPEMLIISDVDDTVLKTEVTDKKKMLYNTFLVDWRKREPVAGTPEIYRKLVGEPGKPRNLLVFLSASPIYIAPRIEGFLKQNRFPPFALFVRKLGVKENIWDRIFPKGEEKIDPLDVQMYKGAKIFKLLRLYPKLPVILLGDSGEKDPEIYKRIAFAFRDRIKCIVIRDVTGQRDEDPRYKGISNLAPLIVWKDSNDLASRLKAQGLIQ